MRIYLVIFSLLLYSSCYCQVAITNVSKDPQVVFGIQKIKEEAAKKRWMINETLVVGQKRKEQLVIEIVTDSLRAKALVQTNGWKPVKSFDAQCYAIRINAKKGKQKDIFVLAGGSTGAMYGALDIAEAIECNSFDGLIESDNIPYLKNRGIKFNIPLDLRTPTYSDPGDAHQQNIPDVWNINFWQEYFDEMALHRYNVMTWWSLQPFPSMVKVPEFPEVALNDVWRTREKYNDGYSSLGLGFDSAYLFTNVEVVKKITIDEKLLSGKK
jgi:hypothetical protein